MKKFKHLSLILVTLCAIVFTSCENEPLEGEFIVEEPAGASGNFIATIDGEAFSATEVSAQILMGNLVISASDTSTRFGISISNKSECVFDLTGISSVVQLSITGGPSYTSSSLGGGETSGTLEITSYDTDNLTVSGTFQFVGVEITPDGPGTETITVTEGSFTNIPFTVTSGDAAPSECVPPGTGGGGDPDPGPDPDPAILFAKADGIDFVPAEVLVSQYMVGMMPMIQVQATDAIGATLRLDVPETLVTGTFDLFTGISDGAQLIGYYDPNTGGETLSSNPGTITITEFSSLTGKLVANFEFTAQDPLGEDPTVVQITEGNLDVAFVATPGNVSFAFEAEVDGNQFAAEAATAVMDTFNGVSIITITATMGDETIQIDFPVAAAAEGTYGMSPALVTGNEIVGTYAPMSGLGNSFTSNPGTLVITAYDMTSNIIEGTFSFTAKDPTATDPAVYQINNGSFMLVIQ